MPISRRMDKDHETSALGRPRGIRSRGRWEGGSGWGIHVNPWLIHVNVWQKLLQYCKVISLQLIKIKEKKKKDSGFHVFLWLAGMWIVFLLKGDSSNKLVHSPGGWRSRIWQGHAPCRRPGETDPCPLQSGRLPDVPGQCWACQAGLQPLLGFTPFSLFPLHLLCLRHERKDAYWIYSLLSQNPYL